MHQDRLKISTNGLNMPKKKKSPIQEALSNGEKIYYGEDGMYIIKDNKRIYLEKR